MFRCFDKDSDSVLEFDEFLLGCACLFTSKGDPKKKIEYVFDFYDTNNDGQVSLNEIKKGYKSLFRMLGSENIDFICVSMAEEAMKDVAGEQKHITKGKSSKYFNIDVKP